MRLDIPSRLIQPFSGLKLENNLPFAFLCVFSRFEFALKTAGYLMSIEEGANAKPDWTCFSRRIHSKYASTRESRLSQAVDFLLKKPPKKQIVKSDGSLGFKKPTENRSDADWLLILVCRVRNNLFHGGKYSEGELYSKRDEELMLSSLVVLDFCLDWNEEVKRYYLG